MAKKATTGKPKAKPKAWPEESHMHHRYTVGFSASEEELVARAAALSTVPVGTWLRMVAVKVARDIILAGKS
jgi:hypothetical protein